MLLITTLPQTYRVLVEVDANLHLSAQFHDEAAGPVQSLLRRRRDVDLER